LADIHQVFNITGPIFAIIIIGYLAVKFAVVPKSSSEALSSFVVNFAVPALLFQAISQRPVAEIFNRDYLVAYGAGSLLAFATLYAISLKLNRRSYSHSAIFAMGGSFSNSLMIGFPIVVQLYGSAAMLPLALTLMVENFIIFPITLIIAEAGEQSAQGKMKILATALGRIVRNPIVAAIFLGVVFSYSGAELPQVAIKVIDMFSATVSGVALFAIGSMLVGINARSAAADVALVLPIKLVVHPLMVLLVLSLFPHLDPQLKATAVILACMPMVGVYPVVAQRYGLGQTCAAVLVPTTICSFITINIAIWWVGSHLLAG